MQKVAFPKKKIAGAATCKETVPFQKMGTAVKAEVRRTYAVGEGWWRRKGGEKMPHPRRSGCRTGAGAAARVCRIRKMAARKEARKRRF